MPGAEPFKSKWSKAQREACIAAMMEHGYSARLAAEAANRGELPGRGMDLEAFPIPEATVADWGKDARRLARQQERAAESPADRLRAGLGDLVATWERDVEKVRKARSQPKPEKIAALAKAGRELEAMARGLHKAPAGRPAEGNGAEGSGDGEHGDDFLGELAKNESGGANGKRKGAQAGRSLAARSGSS